MPWPSLLTLFDFFRILAKFQSRLFGEKPQSQSGAHSHLVLASRASRATCPRGLEAMVSCPCAETGSLLWLLPLLSSPAEPVVPSASHETRRQIPGFLWAFCFIWLCGGCASRAHPGSLAGRRRRLAPGCRLSLLALLPCSTFYVSFPLLFFPPSLSFFFLLFQHGFPKKFFNQSNLRQKIGFVTPGPGIV